MTMPLVGVTVRLVDSGNNHMPHGDKKKHWCGAPFGAEFEIDGHDGEHYFSDDVPGTNGGTVYFDAEELERVVPLVQLSPPPINDPVALEAWLQEDAP